MNCAEFKDSVAALALGILDDEERRACEAHLAEPGPHEGCAEELRRANDAATLLAVEQLPVPPGEHVWAAIEKSIDAEAGAPGAPAATRAGERRTAAPATRPPSVSRGGGGGRGWTAAGWGLAAAAGLAAILLYGQRQQDLGRIGDLQGRLGDVQGQLARARSEQQQLGDMVARVRTADEAREACLEDLKSARVSLREKELALELLGEPATMLVRLDAQDKRPYRASALLNRNRKEAVLISNALTPQPGKDYQLWLIRGDKKISAGLLQVADSGATVARIEPALLTGGAPDALAVTIEPAGGVPQPTGPIVLLGKVT